MLASTGWAQIGNPQEIFRPSLLHPTDVHLADLNNDGRMDVITNSEQDGKIV